MTSDRPVRIVVDSTSSMPDGLLEGLGVTVVPVAVQIGDRTYNDGVDLSREEFYATLAAGARPLTSQPAPGTFYDAYRRLVDQDPGAAIISIHVTGKHSGTVQSAKLAAEMFPERDIEVVDSQYTTAALGLITLAAVRAARLGRSKREILQAIEEARQRVVVYMCVPTLEYLKRSGRVSFAQAALADILAIKPILTMREGVLEVAEKVRTYRRALERAIAMVEEKVGQAKVQMAIVHANAPEAAQAFRQQAEARLNAVSTFVADIGSALAAHGGPGMLGIACLRES